MLRCVSTRHGLLRTTVRLLHGNEHDHDHHSEDNDHRPIEQKRDTGGIAEQELVASPSIAFSSTPPKSGRMASPRKRLSGQQQEILVLYRAFMREVKKLEDETSRNNLQQHIREEFKEHAKIPRKLLSKIEWRMHHGRNKLEDLKAMKPTSKFRVMTTRQQA